MGRSLTCRTEYAQALHFDQLKKLMKEGKAFVGFEEGPINFPPTFKYDVLRTLKKPKRSPSKRGQSPQTDSPAYTSQDQLALEERDDVISIASTVSRSSSSTSGDEQVEAAVTALPAKATDVDSGPSKVIYKTRKRWLSLLSTRLSPYRSSKPSPEGSVVNTVRKSMEETQRLNKSRAPTPAQRHSLDTSHGRALQLQPPAILISSTTSSLHSEEQQADPDKGVYDSSHKQRVPSW